MKLYQKIKNIPSWLLFMWTDQIKLYHVKDTNRYLKVYYKFKLDGKWHKYKEEQYEVTVEGME